MDKVLPRLGAVVDFAGRFARTDGILEVPRCAPQGIVTFSDSQLDATASAIAADLGLRFNSPNVTRLFLDKYEQRVTLTAAGLTVPGFISIPSGATAGREIAAVDRSRGLPAVLKPRTRVSEPRDVPCRACRRRARSARTGRGSPTTSISTRRTFSRNTFTIVRRTTPTSSAVTYRWRVWQSTARYGASRVTGKFALDAPFRETGNFIPSLLEPAEEDEITALAGQVAGALGVEHGCLHTEIKLTPDGPARHRIEPRGSAGAGSRTSS